MAENHMEKYRIEVVGDKKTKFRSLLRELQLIVNETIVIVVKQYGEKPIELSNWAAIVILKRIVESTKAGEVLICNDYDRDAAILITNQMELRLDLQYISKDYYQAKTWLTHNRSNKKPWKVGEQLERLFEDKNEYEAEKKMYRQFSMVKHGNPVAETFAFPLAIKNGCLVTPPQEDILLSKFGFYIFAFFGELFRAYKAAINDFKRCGFDVKEQENKANFINAAINDLYTESIYEQVNLLEKISPKPELCNSCCAFPGNNVEITCLIKRNECGDKFSCDKYKPTLSDNKS